MAKVKQGALLILLMLLTGKLEAQYAVHYQLVDSSSSSSGVRPRSLQESFPSLSAAQAFIQTLPSLLQAEGYISASVDSARFDSLAGAVQLFLGHRYTWARVRTSAGDGDLLQALRWNSNSLSKSVLNMDRLQQYQQRLLAHLEETGHPFARIYLDSVTISGGEVEAVLKIDRGPLYKIDSIRVYGDARISNELLQRHLDIPAGSIYNKKKLLAVDKKLAELVYVQPERPSDLTLLGTGSVLNVYLKAKKNNQVNALVGLLPNAEATGGEKLQVAGEANILLRNSLGGGETLGLNWQQLQLRSPRLTLLYDQPYFLRSPVGIGFNFEMLRKDTTFLNILANLSAAYRVGRRTASIFLQRRQSIVNGVNVQQVLFRKALPPEGDVSSNNLGVAYDYGGTDYRPNPRRGAEFSLSASAGTKRLKKNSQILALKDPSDPSFRFERLYDTVPLRMYQFRVVGAAARYFPIGRQSTLRTALQGGWYQSPVIYRNETFQIGGYRLLRGFDEESQFVSRYAVGTLEYRLLLSQNSYFFFFGDGGWAWHPVARQNHTYLSTGMGLSFETGSGIFNLALALGRRDDADFNLRQSKVHLGFISYF